MFRARTKDGEGVVFAIDRNKVVVLLDSGELKEYSPCEVTDPCQYHSLAGGVH